MSSTGTCWQDMEFIKVSTNEVSFHKTAEQLKGKIVSALANRRTWLEKLAKVHHKLDLVVQTRLPLNHFGKMKIAFLV